MKAIELQQFGIEHLHVVDQQKPEPGAGQVLVRIRAVSLNFLDLAIAKGTYNPHLSLPHTPGSDGAGEVVKVGSGVTGWTPGDRVVLQFTQEWRNGSINPDVVKAKLGSTMPGVLAEYVVVPAYGLVKMPQHMTFAEAATLPVAGLTAWAGLMEHGELQAGQTILTQGTGGVSVAALQIAKASGARVIATTGSSAKEQQLYKLGADAVINYKTSPDWVAQVLEITGGVGVDVTIDVAGPESINQSIKAVKTNGTVGVIGFLSGFNAELNLMQVILKNVKIKGYQGGSSQSFKKYVQALEAGQVKPVIDKVFHMDTIKEAYQYLERGKHFGKIVVKV